MSSRKMLFWNIIASNFTFSVHPKVRQILTLPVEQKTDRALRIAQTALRDIKSCAEYPTLLQKKLCRLGWYLR